MEDKAIVKAADKVGEATLRSKNVNQEITEELHRRPLLINRRKAVAIQSWKLSELNNLDNSNLLSLIKASSLNTTLNQIRGNKGNRVSISKPNKGSNPVRARIKVSSRRLTKSLRRRRRRD